MGVEVSEARVFMDGPVSGEHGLEKVVMEIDLDGRTLRLESGEVGRLAAGSVVAKQGNSVIYTSACGDLDLNKEEVIEDFVPMSVHYQERSSAAGKTSGGYIKRDGRPSDEEVLVSRIIDRSLRPLFPSGFCREVQVLSWVLSYDPEHNVDPIALISASAALLSSKIPFDTPVAGVAVGMDAKGKFVVNPTRDMLKESRLNLFVSGTEESVMMIEGAADFLTEEEMAEAIETGMKAVTAICKGLRAFADKVKEARGIESLTALVRTPDASLYAQFEDQLSDAMDKAMRTGKTGKFDVYGAIFDVEREAKKLFLDESSDTGREIDVKATFKRFAAEKMRLLAKNEDLRIDGRGTKAVRPISINMNPLPAASVHGSSLFTRGDTQTLATVTLGDKGSRQRMDTLDGENSKRFYLQYTFPPSCNGEVGRIGAIGRREIGHGNLAERSLLPIIPSEVDFPYTIRVESLVTESCGSSSMASVCSGSLALFDAGVPVKRAVAGVAMGLLLPDNLKRGNEDMAVQVDEEAVILTDILGLEDGFGTMDFKVAGDAKGITAFQLDIKCEGLSINLLKRALTQAKEGRLHMLYHMLKAKKEPTDTLAPSVPKMLTMSIPQSAIGKVIGPGGAMIRSLIEDFELINIDIDESGSEGVVTVTSLNKERNQKAEEKIRFLVQEANNFSPSGGTGTMNKRVADPEVGKVYKDCLVVGVHPFGCFVELYAGKEGLVHVSELDNKRINNVLDLFKVGDKMDVKVMALKDQKGKIRLSRKAAMGNAETPPTDAPAAAGPEAIEAQ